MAIGPIQVAGAAFAVALSASATIRGPEIRIDDVDRVYALSDPAGGKPSEEQIQRQYLDKSSAGLIEFAKQRKITSDRITKAINERPAIYANARQCAAVLPSVKSRLAIGLARLS